MLSSCQDKPTRQRRASVIETSAAGAKMDTVAPSVKAATSVLIKLDTSIRYQTITGIGGSFTESTAYLLNQLSPAKRQEVIEAYFGTNGAQYSLTRTHINSCDFSLGQYAYSSDPSDKELTKFDISPDKEDIIPIIKAAQAVSDDGFKIIASPWTAPPYMKDNKDWVGGKLLPEYRDTWALYFSKYIEAYASEGIDIWGITVENEPLGNGNNWESMHYTAEEMTDFVVNHLGPSLEANGHAAVQLLGYDQNRDHLTEWVDAMYDHLKGQQYFDGTAIHWYASTYDVFPDVLQYAHDKAPDKYLIETEGCVDAEVPHWQDDEWYWRAEATDWGWDWAPQEEKHLHPKYVPVYRYARDIIGCLNNWVDGWIDWNMVLDRQGGPNWFKNWCLAPVIVDPAQDAVYYTPMYYTLAHFSKYIRPGAQRIELEIEHDSLLATSVLNPDESIAVVLLNTSNEAITYQVQMNNYSEQVRISPQAIQTMVLDPVDTQK